MLNAEACWLEYGKSSGISSRGTHSNVVEAQTMGEDLGKGRSTSGRAVRVNEMVPDHVDHGMPLLLPSLDPNIDPYAGHTDPQKIQGTHEDASLATKGVDVERLSHQGTAYVTPVGVNMHGKLPFSMKALMDPESGITGISESLVKKMQQYFGGVVLMKPLHQPFPVKIANDFSETIGSVTRPLNAALHSDYGPVVVRNLVLAVISGNVDVNIVDSKTLRDVLGFDIKRSFEEVAQRKTELHITDLEQDITSMRCMSVSMKVMQESIGTAHLDRGNDSVSGLLGQGPELMMDPIEEGQKRGLGLESPYKRHKGAGCPWVPRGAYNK
ncbi:unnamed protein product [Choristocarpus tenellus]